MADWVGIAETTIRDYIRDVEVDVVRNRKLLALMQSRGRITYNHSGTDMDWKIRFRRAVPKAYADMDTQTFPRRNRHKTAVLGFRAYSLTESISKLDRLKNKGTPAIVKILEEKVTSMSDDMEDFFGDELYIDGNATGNTKRIHGVESFTGAGSVSTQQPIAFPSDTFAGLSTALGNYGGSWSSSGGVSTWPVGKGNAEYDFYSPLLVDYTNSFWNRSSNIWQNTCTDALRYGIIHTRKNKGKRGQLDMYLLNDQLYEQFVGVLSQKERITVVQGGGQNGDSLTGLGFSDVTNFEGAEVTFEYGTPASTGYGFNVDMMELCSMQSKLFETEGPFENEVDKTLRWSIDFFGNAKWFPRNFVKLLNYT